MSSKKVLSYAGLSHFFDGLKNIFVGKEAGKGLSTNDYTTEEKTKLAGLSDPNIQTVKVNDSALTPDANKAVNIDLSSYALKTEVAGGVKVKGSVANYAALPALGQEVGDMYNVQAADSTHGIKAGDNVVWTGEGWDNFGGIIDLSGYVEKVAGKGLSTNDYTTEEKNKLAGLSNYTHPTGDGNEHVPANGTTNSGKFLMATATAGTYEWTDIVEVQEITNAEIDTLFSN